MRCTRVLVPVLVLGWAARAQSAEGAVRVWDDSTQFPTYIEGEADPSPQFSIYASDAPNYPYAVRSNFTGKRRNQAWRTLHLENEYLHCRVLPDLGGHLYSCLDKRNQREMFYANPVIKKAAIGLRGAWTALGVESNFPVGHSRQTVSPVDFATRTEPDGSASAILEATDRVTGMEWRVEYLLRPGSTVLEQRVSLYNSSPVRRPYYWWSNADVALDDPAMRFVVPTRVVRAHGINELSTWPISPAGLDESLIASHQDSGAWFAVGSHEPFFAAYKPGSRSAVAHFADPNIVAGKKAWFWGKKGDEYVERELTDGFPSYIEIQGGLFESQEVFQFLEAEQWRVFSEFWMPVYDLGGVTRVSPDAILNLERPKAPSKDLVLELSTTHSISRATLRVGRSGQTVFEERVDLDPAKTYKHAIENAPAGPCVVQLISSTGAILLQHTEGVYDSSSPETVKIGKQPDKDWNQPETEAFLLERGNYNELQQHWKFALNDYSTGLQKFPESVALQKAAGRLALELNRFEEAAALLARVHAATPADDEAAYLLGAANVMLGHDPEAQRALAQVKPSSPVSAAARFETALIAARARDWNTALSALSTLPGTRARGLEVAVLRHAGREPEALSRLASAFPVDPSDVLLRSEASIKGYEDPDFASHLGADSERVLDLTDEYLSLGMYEDALNLLSRSYAAPAFESVEPGVFPPNQSALIVYYRAYCEALLGKGDPKAELAAASHLSMLYAFPFRPSSYRMLKTLQAADPSNSITHFLLGRLWMSSLMADEAISEWQTAVNAKANFPEPYLDLARARAELKHDPAGATAVLNQGLAVMPRNPDLRAALDRANGKQVAAVVHTLPAVLKADPKTPASIVAEPANPIPSKSPIEVASSALVTAGSGKPDNAAGLFDPKIFSSEKQPDDVRRDYIEVQLQRVAAEANAGKCEAALDHLDRMGEEDTNLAFTMYGFNAFMKEPHFQYYSAEIEVACGALKKAIKRWTKVSKMTANLPSPEFVFPLLAASKLNPEAAKAKIVQSIQSVRWAMQSADAQSKQNLVYAEAMLLHATGQSDPATQELADLAKTADGMLRYLILIELRQITQ